MKAAPRKLTAKERCALAEFAKPVGKHDYNKLHGRTIHALERKGLIACSDRKPGRQLTAAGRAELVVPDVFDDLFAKEPAVPKAKKTLPDKPFAEFRAIEFIETALHDPVRERWVAGCDESGMRLYCTSSPHTHGSEHGRWAFQFRARVKTRGGRPGKHFAVGTASMSRADLQWLRDLITTELRRKS